MGPVSFITLTIIFYLVIFYLRRTKKLEFFERNGVGVGLFQLKWTTQRFNRFFVRVGNGYKRFLVVWYTVGAVVSSLLILPALILLLKTLIGSIAWLFQSKDEDESAETFVLQPVIPGLNMPISKTVHYMVTLLICTLVHEFGHAVTCVADDVTVLESGVFLFLVLPAAFVNISTLELNAVGRLQQLRIFAAGVWNNIVLTFVAFGILLLVPFLCSPFYTREAGVTVIHVEPNSTVLGPSGLKYGDVVTSINGCSVKNAEGWHHCLAETDHRPVQSFCLNLDHRVEDNNCCKDDQSTGGNLCFLDSKHETSHCLKVRPSLDASTFCNDTDMSFCPSPNSCMRPILKNPSRLIQIKRKDEKDFLFVGNAAEVYYYSQVTNYVPKHSASFLTPTLPSNIELLMYYIASLSAGLAVLNVVPCFMLDGQHITRVLTDIIFKQNELTKSIALMSLTAVGTLLIFLNLLFGVIRLCLS